MTQLITKTSLLDGSSSIGDKVARAVRTQTPAAGITCTTIIMYNCAYKLQLSWQSFRR